MHQCKSGRHFWLNEADADKCCNGYRRILVFGRGENQQQCDGVTIGRGWVKNEPPHDPDKQERTQ